MDGLMDGYQWMNAMVKWFMGKVTFSHIYVRLVLFYGYYDGLLKLFGKMAEEDTSRLLDAL